MHDLDDSSDQGHHVLSYEGRNEGRHPSRTR